jgi:hypothetical protein
VISLWYLYVNTAQVTGRFPTEKLKVKRKKLKCHSLYLRFLTSNF